MNKNYDNKARLWSNSSDNIKAPQMTGKGQVNGQEVVVSAWYRTTEKGVVIDLTFGPPRGGRQQTPRYEDENQDTDSVPF